MNSSIALLIVVGLAALVILIYYSNLVKKKRNEALQRAADELGLYFSSEGDEALRSSLSGFHLFSQGHSKRLTGLIQGVTRHVGVAIFDYRYVTTRGNKNDRSREQTVICFQLGKQSLPTFCLRPENVWHKMGAWLGGQDIDFESHPTFSAKYLLQGEDESAIRDLFTDEALAFYEARPGLCTEGGGDRLLFYRSSVRVKPEAIHSFMEEGFAVLALFQRE